MWIKGDHGYFAGSTSEGRAEKAKAASVHKAAAQEAKGMRSSAAYRHFVGEKSPGPHTAIKQKVREKKAQAKARIRARIKAEEAMQKLSPSAQERVRQAGVIADKLRAQEFADKQAKGLGLNDAEAKELRAIMDRAKAVEALKSLRVVDEKGLVVKYVNREGKMLYGPKEELGLNTQDRKVLADVDKRMAKANTGKAKKEAEREYRAEHRREDIVQTVNPYGPKAEVPVVINPTKQDVVRLAHDELRGNKSIVHGDELVRMIKTDTGEVYAWPAGRAIHIDVLKALKTTEVPVQHAYEDERHRGRFAYTYSTAARLTATGGVKVRMGNVADWVTSTSSKSAA